MILIWLLFIELKVAWVSPMYFKTIHLTALIVLCEALCFHWGLYCHKMSHTSWCQSPACLDSQSVTRSADVRAAPCVCVKTKKRKRKNLLLFLWGLTWWWHAVLLWELPDRRDRLFAWDSWGRMKSMRAYDGQTCQTPAIETDMMTDIDTGGQ